MSAAKPIPTWDECVSALAEHLIASAREEDRERLKEAREEGEVVEPADDGELAERVRQSLFEDDDLQETVYAQTLVQLKLLAPAPKTER